MDEKKEVSTAHLEDPVEHVESGKTKYAANTQMDDAARMLAEAGHHEFDPADKRRVLRKVDLYVCLPMCLMYLAQQESFFSWLWNGVHVDVEGCCGEE